MSQDLITRIQTFKFLFSDIFVFKITNKKLSHEVANIFYLYLDNGLNFIYSNCFLTCNYKCFDFKIKIAVLSFKIRTLFDTVFLTMTETCIFYVFSILLLSLIFQLHYYFPLHYFFSLSQLHVQVNFGSVVYICTSY